MLDYLLISYVLNIILYRRHFLFLRNLGLFFFNVVMVYDIKVQVCF
jgi:hypothetical protein